MGAILPKSMPAARMRLTPRSQRIGRSCKFPILRHSATFAGPPAVLVLLLALATVSRLKFEVNELGRTPPAKALVEVLGRDNEQGSEF